jgi:hypothetical protein
MGYHCLSGNAHFINAALGVHDVADDLKSAISLIIGALLGMRVERAIVSKRSTGEAYLGSSS